MYFKQLNRCVDFFHIIIIYTDAIEWFHQTGGFNFFWHQEDTLTITSRGHLWVYPGKQPIEDSIAVMPEIHNDNVSKCLGICSDYIERYK